MIESACCLRSRKRKPLTDRLPVIPIRFYRGNSNFHLKRISQFHMMDKAYCSGNERMIISLFVFMGELCEDGEAKNSCCFV